MKQRSGNAIVEVLVGISIAALIIVSVGNLVTSVNRTDKAAANKNQALAYARENLEVMAAIAKGEFQCTVGNPGCTCTAQTGYTTCWQACPITSGCAATYHIANSSGWHLVNGSETVGTAPVYTRSLTLTSIGGNTNLKNVTVTMSWTESGRTRTVTETTLLSGWKQ